jgi:hypothetical protein
MSSPAIDISDAVSLASELPADSTQSAVRHPIWPKAVIAFGFSLTVGWMILLGYGVVMLVELAI